MQHRFSLFGTGENGGHAEDLHTVADCSYYFLLLSRGILDGVGEVLSQKTVEGRVFDDLSDGFIVATREEDQVVIEKGEGGGGPG